MRIRSRITPFRSPLLRCPVHATHPLTQLDTAQALGFEGIASCSDSATGAPQSPDTMVRPARRLGGPAGGQQSFIQPPFVPIPRQGLLRSLLRCWLLQLAWLTLAGSRPAAVAALNLGPCLCLRRAGAVVGGQVWCAERCGRVVCAPEIHLDIL